MQESCHLTQVEVIAETQGFREEIRNEVTFVAVFIRFFKLVNDRIQWQTSVGGVLRQCKFDNYWCLGTLSELCCKKV